MPRLAALILFAWTTFAPAAGQAQERAFTLSAPEVLQESGLLGYILPRFALKTGIRPTVVEPSETADIALTQAQDGIHVFDGLGAPWHLVTKATANPNVARFSEWITSDIGKNTINAFASNDGDSFIAADKAPAEAPPVFMTGDPEKGAVLALEHCGRCHAVTRAHRKNSIGSTPSFAALRTLPDWQNRFSAFFTLNPHPAFTAIEDVTLPFSENRPPPIHPLSMTIEDLDHILAFVAVTEPADLGSPIQYQ